MQENLTLVHWNNKRAGLSLYPGSLIKAFTVRLLLKKSKHVSCKTLFKLVSVADQTGLSLTQSETCKTSFPRRWPQCISNMVFYFDNIEIIHLYIIFTIYFYYRSNV